MELRPTALERAFTLARSGDCATLTEVREKLSAEGYGLQQITGPSLLRQLREICTTAAAGKAAEG